MGTAGREPAAEVCRLVFDGNGAPPEETGGKKRPTSRREAPGRSPPPKNKPIAARTIDREISVLRAAVLLYASKHPGAPAPRIYSVELPGLHTRWLTTLEAGALLAAAISAHVGPFILLMLATAVRPEAIFDLR